MYNPLPVYHSDCGIRAFHEMMPIGGATFTSDRFRPTRFWDDVRAAKATVIHYLGIVTTFLMAQPELPSDREHQVRFALGAGVEPGRQDYFEKRFGFPLLEMWGMTECMRVLCDSIPPRTLGKRAVGRPRPGLDVKLVDENDQEVPVGQEGEMCIRHSAATPRRGVFSGYLDDPAATEHAWRGGWFHTGDTLRQDETGCLYFVDRKKNIIRRSGENIAAVEVEGILGKHPRVAQCAVIAVKDELREEEVFACVVVPIAGEGDERGRARRAGRFAARLRQREPRVPQAPGLAPLHGRHPQDGVAEDDEVRHLPRRRRPAPAPRRGRSARPKEEESEHDPYPAAGRLPPRPGGRIQPRRRGRSRPSTRASTSTAGT